MSQQELEAHMKQLISKVALETEFALRDIIPNPPAGLGRRLYEGVNDGTIANVGFMGKRAGVDI